MNPSSHLLHARADQELGFDRQLAAGALHGLFRHLLVHAAQLEHHGARLHRGHPVFRSALAFSHAGFGGLLREGLVRKDADPDLAAPLHVARDGDAARLDLPVGDPFLFQSHQPEVAERYFGAAGGPALHFPAHLLAVFRSLGAQHDRLLLTSVTAAVAAVAPVTVVTSLAAPAHEKPGVVLLRRPVDLAVEYPDLDADAPEGGDGGRRAVVDVGAEGVQRNAPFLELLAPRHFRPGKPARNLHLDPLHAGLHRVQAGHLARPAVRGAGLDLPPDVFRHELRVRLGAFDLLDAELDLLADALLQLPAQLLDVRALRADEHAGAAGVDDHRDSLGVADDLHLGDVGALGLLRV